MNIGFSVPANQQSKVEGVLSVGEKTLSSRVLPFLRRKTKKNSSEAHAKKKNLQRAHRDLYAVSGMQENAENPLEAVTMNNPIHAFRKSICHLVDLSSKCKIFSSAGVRC